MADKQKPAPQSGVKPRKIPMRQCLGCNEHRPKAELLRVLRGAVESAARGGEARGYLLRLLRGGNYMHGVEARAVQLKEAQRAERIIVKLRGEAGLPAVCAGAHIRAEAEA